MRPPAAVAAAPPQVVVNTAMARVVVEETPPGTMGWLTWRDVLHLFNVLCCCAMQVQHWTDEASYLNSESRSLVSESHCWLDSIDVIQLQLSQCS